MVVVVAPVVHDAPGAGEALEPVLVQAAVPELAVEALHESVLGGLAGLDEVQRRAGPLAPKAHRLAGELGAVVADDGLGRRLALSPARPGKGTSQTSVIGSAHQLAGAKLGKAVDGIQGARAPAAGDLGLTKSRPAWPPEPEAAEAFRSAQCGRAGQAASGRRAGACGSPTSHRASGRGATVAGHRRASPFFRRFSEALFASAQPRSGRSTLRGIARVSCEPSLGSGRRENHSCAWAR